MASTYLTRTFGSPSAPGGGTFKWTMSAWVKKTGTGADVGIMTRYVNSGKFVKIFFNSDDQLEYAVYNSSYQARYQTTARYRDVNSWYHVVVAQNSTLATAADRVKIYVNGELITSFAVNTQIGQNIGGDFNTASAPHQIGAYNAVQFFNGLISHFHFCDNYQYAASDFGSVDSTTGEWKINTSPSVSYGTTGFTILKDGNTITDQSTNSNNFSLGGGTLTKSEDNPSNVFATMNVLANFGTQWAFFENGSTYVRSAGTGEAFIASTLGIPATNGKFYTEVRYTSGGSASNIGISGRMNPTAAADYVGNKTDSYVYRQNGQKKSDDVASSYGDSYAPGDLIGIAVDATNSKIYFSKNGVWQNSGDPTSGATGTGAAFTISTTPTDGFYFMACAKESGSTKNYYKWNFGNGYFGTTAVSSAGTNASGNGIFEYDVPNGFTAISTKGLNT